MPPKTVTQPVQPAVMTRSKQENEFDHVIGIVLNKPATSPMRLALAKAGYDNIINVVSMANHDVNSLVFDDAAGTDQDLPRGDKQLLRAFWYYVMYRTEQELETIDAIMSLLREDFDKFRMGPWFLLMVFIFYQVAKVSRERPRPTRSVRARTLK